jgi:hypothetical protein
MPPASRKTPQDRKAKAVDGFTFKHEGITHRLPPPGDVMTKIDGRAFRDMLMDGEAGELKLAFICLEAVCTEPDDILALNALYAKPFPETVKLAGEWFRSADTSGATLPQS